MYADSNESGQNRLEWLKILEMLWSELRLISKTSSVTPDFFYVFYLILSFSTVSQSFKKIFAWEVFRRERPWVIKSNRIADVSNFSGKISDPRHCVTWMERQ